MANSDKTVKQLRKDIVSIVNSTERETRKLPRGPLSLSVTKDAYDIIKAGDSRYQELDNPSVGKVRLRLLQMLSIKGYLDDVRAAYDAGKPFNKDELSAIHEALGDVLK